MQTPYQQQPVPPPHPKSNKAIIAVKWVLTVVGAFFGGREFLRWELRRTLEDAFSGLATNDTPLPFSEPADNDGNEEQPVAREKVTATPLLHPAWGNTGTPWDGVHNTALWVWNQ